MDKQKFKVPTGMQEIDLIFCNERKNPRAESVLVWVPLILSAQIAQTQPHYIYHLSEL